MLFGKAGFLQKQHSLQISQNLCLNNSREKYFIPYLKKEHTSPSEKTLRTAINSPSNQCSAL